MKISTSTFVTNFLALKGDLLAAGMDWRIYYRQQNTLSTFGIILHIDMQLMFWSRLERENVKYYFLSFTKCSQLVERQYWINGTGTISMWHYQLGPHKKDLSFSNIQQVIKLTSALYWMAPRGHSPMYRKKLLLTGQSNTQGIHSWYTGNMIMVFMWFTSWVTWQKLKWFRLCEDVKSCLWAIQTVLFCLFFVW